MQRKSLLRPFLGVVFLSAAALLLCACGVIGASAVPEGVEVVPFDAQTLIDELSATSRAYGSQLIFSYAPTETLDADIQSAVDHALSSRFDCAFNVDTVTWNLVDHKSYIYTKFSILYETDAGPRPETHAFAGLDWGSVVMDMLVNQKTSYSVCIPREDVDKDTLSAAIANGPQDANAALFSYLTADSSWYLNEYEDYWVPGFTFSYRKDARSAADIYEVDSPYAAACYLIDAMLTGDETVTLYVKSMEKARLQLLWDTARINDGEDMVEESVTGSAAYWDNKDGSYIVELKSQYSGTAQTREAYRLALMTALDTLEQQIRDEAPKTEEETYLLIAKTIAEKTAYDKETSDASIDETLTPEMRYLRTAYGALVAGDSVCTGYAAAFKALCDRFALPCWVMLGSFDGVGHAWNVVLLNDEVRYVDVTFFDTARSSKYLLFTQQAYEKQGYTLEDGYVMPDWYPYTAAA